MQSLIRFAPNDPRLRAWNDQAVRSGAEYVLYWMQMYRRADDNAALAYALERANELGLPCVVYEALRPDYPFASDRFHTFVLESARDVAAGLAERGVAYRFFLPRTRDDARGVLAKVAARAALVVTDEFPSFIVPEQTAALASRAGCAVLSVDDCAVVPMALLPKAESGARTLRPKMARLRDAWLRPLEEPKARVKAPARLELPFEAAPVDSGAIETLVEGCAIDHTVPPVAETRGGGSAALARAESFMQRGLRGYAEGRNDPSRTGTSGLSGYLHFGMISARKVALMAESAAVELGAGEAKDAFLEQLLVRRGLAFNFARMNARHRELDALPAWARRTLAEHAGDPRPATVTMEELTEARSPDALWNAAQMELRVTGVIQGYARMLWGKLPLLWMKEPREAHAALVALNDRFALDGRDPGGYANIGWCFGLHDRPWPKRAVFGAVRAMTSRSARGKMDFEGYVEEGGRRRREMG